MQSAPMIRWRFADRFELVPKMLLSKKYNFIFVHIYKNAGSSISDALGPYSPNRFVWSFQRGAKMFGRRLPFEQPTPCFIHATASEIIQSIGREEYEKYFSFAFVRNPWDWQVSLFNYARKDKRHPQHKFTNDFESFDEYIEWRCEHEVRLQRDFVFSPVGEQLVSFLGKFETLDEDFNQICSKLGIDTSLKKLNVSSTADYRSYYESKSRKLVADAFEADIVTFNYSF